MKLALSPAARSAVQRDLPDGHMLRVAFAGGCGALGFRLAVTRRALPEDLHVELAEVTVLLDRLAAQELDGATLDYDEDEGFLLDHPSWGISC